MFNSIRDKFDSIEDRLSDIVLIIDRCNAYQTRGQWFDSRSGHKMASPINGFYRPISGDECPCHMHCAVTINIF